MTASRQPTPANVVAQCHIDHEQEIHDAITRDCKERPSVGEVKRKQYHHSGEEIFKRQPKISRCCKWRRAITTDYLKANHPTIIADYVPAGSFTPPAQRWAELRNRLARLPFLMAK